MNAHFCFLTKHRCMGSFSYRGREGGEKRKGWQGWWVLFTDSYEQKWHLARILATIAAFTIWFQIMLECWIFSFPFCITPACYGARNVVSQNFWIQISPSPAMGQEMKPPKAWDLCMNGGHCRYISYFTLPCWHPQCQFFPSLGHAGLFLKTITMPTF